MLCSSFIYAIKIGVKLPKNKVFAEYKRTFTYVNKTFVMLEKWNILAFMRRALFGSPILLFSPFRPIVHSRWLYIRCQKPVILNM